MKPIKYWLNSLPEPYRTQALEVCYPEKLDVLVESPHRAISCMCIWQDTTEGNIYWDSVCKQLQSGTIRLRPENEKQPRQRRKVTYSGVPMSRLRRILKMPDPMYVMFETHANPEE